MEDAPTLTVGSGLAGARAVLITLGDLALSLVPQLPAPKASSK